MITQAHLDSEPDQPLESDIRIRRADPEDAAAVRDLVLSGCGVSRDQTGSNPDLTHFGDSSRSGRIDLIAEVNGAVVGSASLTPIRTDVRLSNLYVAPETRHRGAARTLVNRAIDEARAADYRCIEVVMRADHPEALSLWEHSGWERREDKAGSESARVYYLPLQTA